MVHQHPGFLPSFGKMIHQKKGSPVLVLKLPLWFMDSSHLFWYWHVDLGVTIILIHAHVLFECVLIWKKMLIVVYCMPWRWNRAGFSEWMVQTNSLEGSSWSTFLLPRRFCRPVIFFHKDGISEKCLKLNDVWSYWIPICIGSTKWQEANLGSFFQNQSVPHQHSWIVRLRITIHDQAIKSPKPRAKHPGAFKVYNFQQQFHLLQNTASRPNLEPTLLLMVQKSCESHYGPRGFVHPKGGFFSPGNLRSINRKTPQRDTQPKVLIVVLRSIGSSVQLTRPMSAFSDGISIIFTIVLGLWKLREFSESLKVEFGFWGKSHQETWMFMEVSL